MKLLLIAMAVILSGCSNQHEAGDCVYIEILGTGKVDTFQASFVKFDDGAYWYEKDGVIGATHYTMALITGCGL